MAGANWVGVMGVKDPGPAVAWVLPCHGEPQDPEPDPARRSLSLPGRRCDSAG